ncbi:MAG: ubiquinol oxidase subunit II [Pseudoxanthomonas sp.]
MTIVQTLCRRLLPASALLPLAGCKTILLNAPGDVARQQGDLIVVSTLLMLLIIVPVIALTLFFAWRYRAGNAKATYKPDWDHSTQLELVIWAAPLVIIIALGAITWITTHTLDPYRPLDRIAADKPVSEGTQPLVVGVAALNKQWLFIYPEQGIATINELALPVDRPVRFELTATTVMHSFYVPALAGMIYAMPGMETKLHAVINQPGEWEGFASNYSGPTFNAMRFRFHGLAQADFDAWVAKARAQGGALDRARFLQLDAPASDPAHPYQDQIVRPEPVQYFASVDDTLFHAIVNRCVAEGTVCMDALHHARGGHGEGAHAGHGEAEAHPAGHDMEAMPAQDAPAEEQPDGQHSVEPHAEHAAAHAH